MIRLVAFDWNGTLLADTQPAVLAENLTFKKIGIKFRLTVKSFQDIFEIPIKNYWVKLGFSEQQFAKNAKYFNQIFNEAYEPLEKKCRSRAGANFVLSYLKNGKVTAVIFSNHIRPHIHKQLKRLKLSGHFKEVLARELHDHSHMNSQGKAEKLDTFIKAGKYKPKEVLLVGDTSEEINIAKKYGYYSAAISGGYESNLRLKKSKPDFLIHNLKSLKAIINKLNKDAKHPKN